MKHLRLTTIALWVFASSLQAQNAYQQILSAVDEHSPKLQALRMECQAQHEDARQETVLDDPELSFGYLWGDPGSIGNRWDMSVTQSFDFPTTYLHRKEVKRLTIESANLQFEAAHKEVMLQAQQLCIEIAYNDSLLAMIDQQIKMLAELVNAEHIRLEEGATTVIAYNLAEQKWMQSQGEMHELVARRDAQRMELQALAGIDELPLGQLSLQTLPQQKSFFDFDQWWSEVVTASPLMRYVQNEVQRTQEQVKLSKDGWLPGLKVGYMSENTKAETFRGLTVGVSLPVWNNRHKVKASQYRSSAAELEAQSQKQQFMMRLKGLLGKALEYDRKASELHRMMDAQQITTLLQRQFDEGAITLSDYLSGMIEQVELHKSLLSTEREVQLLWAELHSVE